MTANRSVPSAVLVALTDEESRPQADRLAAQLRSRGIATEIAPKADKFGRQIRFAEKRGIPFVLFVTENGPEIKDIRSGDQTPMDPETWALRARTSAPPSLQPAPQPPPQHRRQRSDPHP